MSTSKTIYLALMLSLAGCATGGGERQAAGTPGPAGGAAATTAEAAEPAVPAAAAEAPALPRPQLDGPTVYQVILGELAFQRGEVGLAAQAYAEAARRTGDAQVLTRAIQFAGASRQYELALDLTRRWVLADPESTHARQSLLGILAALGRHDELQLRLRDLLASDAENRPRNIMHTTRLFAAEPDRRQAMRRVYTLTEPYLDLPESHYARAALAHSAGEQATALEAVRRASTLRFEWPEPWLLEIQILGRERAAEASERLALYLKRHPEATGMRMQSARLLATQKRWAEAREAFLAVADKAEDASEALHAVGLIALQERDHDAAEEIFRKLLATGTMDVNTLHHQLGLIAEDKRDYEKALAELRQVGEGEYFMAAQARVAIVLAKQGKTAEALAHLRVLPATNAQDRQRLVLTEAQVHREAKDFEAAFAVLSQALEREPDQPDLLYDHAMLAERIDRIDVVEGNLNRLIAIDPENAHALNALGYTLADRNLRLEEARQLIVKALALAPDDVYIMDSMGWVLYRLGDTAGALRHLERAWSMRKDPEIAAHLGEVLWVAGRRDEARQIWREARTANPDNELLGTVMQKFLQ